MDILRQVKAVLWSFIGLSGRKRADVPAVNPLVLIAVAFVLVVLFLGTLAVVAKHAAGV
jgi:hypothetical protein